ncbi:hypothetical protein NIES4071_70570 [Calothrix sp. NIES-4071]|nr:hypothetical protein NIES4071_70570 [Calothrix sp. NIES-4071]BAZ61332.1 hypothetical protein NIES4105_70520 [Calothrix sp. NIES-4105]
MSQRDGFAGGFFAGAIVGSVVGGVLGALFVSRRDEMPEEVQQLAPNEEAKKKHAVRRQQIKLSDTESMETARRSLEDKIAQLNATIDEVRQQLSNVPGASNTGETQERV